MKIILIKTGIFSLISGLFIVLVLPNGCTWVAKSTSESIYPALQKPYDNEAPTTPSSFPASSEISAVLGGKGEGLNCSLPVRVITEPLFFSDQEANEAPISLQFRQACAFHDYCYRHGAATYGYKQVDCDFMLQEYAYRLCKQIFTLPKSIKNEKTIDDNHQECMSRARRVLLGVRVGGGGSFKAAGESTYFEFDPIPARADDYDVSRLVTLKKPIIINDETLKKS